MCAGAGGGEGTLWVPGMPCLQGHTMALRCYPVYNGCGPSSTGAMTLGVSRTAFTKSLPHSQPSESQAQGSDGSPSCAPCVSKR